MADTREDGMVAPAGVKCYQLTFKSLEGFANLLGRKVERQATSAEYALRGFLYCGSCVSQHVYESLPLPLVESLQRGAVVCPIDQLCYFYSESLPSSLLLVIELIATVSDGEGQVSKALGWTMMAVREGRERLPLYDGSPRALYSLKQHSSSPQADGGLVPIAGCILSLSLTPHPILSRAVHLFPQHVLITFDDIIPGTTHTSVPEAFPKLVKTLTLSLEKVMLLLLPSVDSYETDLLASLRHDLQTDQIKIVERRLKFMAYNGWSYLSTTIAYLDKVSPSLTTSQRSLHNHLVLRGSTELRNIVPHPLTEIVLTLQYVITWTARALGKVAQTHTTPVTVCWGVWSPYSEEEEIEDVAVELKSGIGYQVTNVPCSAHSICYESGLSDAGKVIFRNKTSITDYATAVTSRTSYGGQRSSLVTFEEEPQYDGGVEHTDSGVALDELKPVSSPAHSSTPQPIPLHDATPLPSTPLHEAVEVHMHRPLAPSGQTRWVEPISRSVLAHLHSAGVPDFGVPHIAPPTAPSTGSSPPHIGLQFMAFDTSSWQSPLHQLVIHYQLYTAVTMRCGLTTPPHPHLPQVLCMAQQFDGSGTRSPCISHHHLTSSTPKNVPRGMSISVSDGDSHIVLGTALIPARVLMAPPTDHTYHQTAIVVPIVSQECTSDNAPPTTSESYCCDDGGVCIGRLYIRVAHLPSSSDNTNRLGGHDVGPGTPLRAAQPLSHDWSPQHHQDEHDQKHNAIQTMLLHTITSTLTITPSLGEAVYFEHVYHHNNTSSNILVTWSEPNLRIVADVSECQYLKKCFNMLSAIDGHLLAAGSRGGHDEQHQLLVHHDETVRIPFRYQRYDHHDNDEDIETKVYIQDASSTRDLLAVFTLHIRPHPHCIDRVYHYYHPEMTFIKRSYQLPSTELYSTSHHDDEDVLVCCSDRDASCELRDEQSAISVKVPVPLSPSVHRVYIMIYCDRYHVKPRVIWQMIIHSVHRVEHTLVVGQSSSLTLTLRGGATNHRVSCYTAPQSLPAAIKVVTPSPQLLVAHSVSELTLSLKSLTPSTSTTTRILATAVDTDNGELLKVWLVMVSVHAPPISRAFNITLDQDCTRTISYTNPYHKRKRFLLSTSRPDLISFQPALLKLQSNQSVSIGLVFTMTTPTAPPTADILVFINNTNDQTEECFLVRATYSTNRY